MLIRQRSIFRKPYWQSGASRANERTLQDIFRFVYDSCVREIIIIVCTLVVKTFLSTNKYGQNGIQLLFQSIIKDIFWHEQ